MNKNNFLEDFPILKTQVNGKPLVYLDNAATTLKPLTVAKAIERYYLQETANIHRGIHYLSEISTFRYEETRDLVSIFINSPKREQVIFTKGTTDALNLVSSSLSKGILKSGETILISEMEHHSNIVPWQMACEYTGANLKIIPINDHGEIILEAYEKLLQENKVKIVSVAYISNVLGTINPIKEMATLAHRYGAWLMTDAAQASAHLKIDVQDLGVDFLAFSGHKTLGPTGIGILWGKEELLNELPPYQGGGDMIDQVTFEKTTYNVLPHKFEAGTPSIASGIGLGPAIQYLNKLSWSELHQHELNLTKLAMNELSKIEGLQLIGTAANKASVVTFAIRDIHPQDLATLLDKDGVAIRTGHHCAQPLMKRFKVNSTARISLSFYNDESDLEVFFKSLHKALGLLR